jgi:dihydrofolate synthase / folylpolyglutamate synthase
VFEVITAAALLLFAETQADICVLEVGLGGRFDATNVIDRPAACAITSISMDHREFLGDTLGKIAFEKAGIMKPGVPCAVGTQAAEVRDVILSHAAAAGTPVLLRGRDWTIAPTQSGLRYEDTRGALQLPPPSLAGAHQHDNAGIAIAALRAAGLGLPDHALAAGIARADWAARMQRLNGALAKLLPDGWELYLDGGHNPGAGLILADQLRSWSDKPTHVIVGMKQAKDSAEFLRPMLPHLATLWAIAEPGQHLALPVEAIIAASGNIARPGPTVAEALLAIPKDGPPARVLICGSLYLAGEILKQDARESG